MWVTSNGEVKRNLEEQVEKNKDDIEALTSVTALTGIKFIGHYLTVEDLYTDYDPESEAFAALEYGDAFAVGNNELDYYYYVKIHGVPDDFLKLKFMYTEGTGTIVTVSGIPQATWNADGKLDKDTSTSTQDRVYVVKANGTQGLYRVDTAAGTGNNVMFRDGGGRCQVVKPATSIENTGSNLQEVVNKQYLLESLGFYVKSAMPDPPEGKHAYIIDEEHDDTVMELTDSPDIDTIPVRDDDGVIHAESPQDSDPDKEHALVTVGYADDHYGGGGGGTVYEHHIYMYYEGGDDPCFYAEFDWYNSSATPYGSVYGCFQDASMADKWICGFSCDTWGAGTLLHDGKVGHYIKFTSTERILTKVDDYHDDGWYSVINDVHEPDISADHSQQWMAMMTFTDRVRALN